MPDPRCSQREGRLGDRQGDAWGKCACKCGRCIIRRGGDLEYWHSTCVVLWKFFLIFFYTRALWCDVAIGGMVIMEVCV